MYTDVNHIGILSCSVLILFIISIDMTSICRELALEGICCDKHFLVAWKPIFALPKEWSDKLFPHN